MRWKSGRRSQNVEDGRGTRMSRRASIGGGGLGILVLALVAMYCGVDPSVVLQGAGGLAAPEQTQQRQAVPAEQAELVDFTKVVLADTEDTWSVIFQQQLGRTYKYPKLKLFSGEVKSACGYAQAAMGPFYCPGDQKVYVDLSFYSDLKNRFGAPGDFAQAYVIAHEIGHHVQTLLGISSQVMKQRQLVSKKQGNALSVRQELQADCLAGVWANHAHRTRNILEQGDLEEGLNAASAIGDDRLQKQGRGYVTPESFTHGSSAQRVRWFKHGLETGDMNQCDTFSSSV
ncbi:MAG: KPN_02809 family neutral zinc metallopeptidase, partial [Pseudomonadales bacterium]